jgi:hypothetical protein
VIVPPIDDPGYAKRTLIINNDLNGPGNWGGPTLARVDSFYDGIMESLGRAGSYTIWRIAQTTPPYQWPPRDTLAKYTSVFVLMEQFIPAIGTGSQQKFQAGQQALFKEYLNIGGKLIWSGTPNCPNGISNYAPPNIPTGSWSYDVFHITANLPQTPYLMCQGADFNGVRGDLGYPSIALDTAKINPLLGDSLKVVKNIGNIGFNFPRGFAQTISFFNSRFGSGFQNFPVGIRFLAPEPLPGEPQTYSVVFFGFGLYYGERTAVVQAIGKAFQDINE